MFFLIRVEQVLKLCYNKFNKIHQGRKMMKYQNFQRYKTGDKYGINEKAVVELHSLDKQQFVLC